MDDAEKNQSEDLFNTVPGSVVKLALDDMLTILYAPDTFYSLVRNVSAKTKATTSLLRMIYSSDVISVTQQLAGQRHREDKRISFYFRILRHDGSFKWILLNGIRLQETFQSGETAVPVYSCAAIDFTDFMLQHKLLEQKMDYHNKITELARDLFFEYDIATDVLGFTEMFREVFGKDSVIKDFREKLKKTKMMPSDEQDTIVRIFDSIMGGRKQVRFELRLIPKDGIPVWYTCYASIIFDENRNPYKVVGKLAMLSTREKDPEEIAYLPVLDPLTDVNTKESMEHLVREAVKKQDPDALSAFMLIDIRNYKNMNEIRSAIGGENILSVIGRRLKGEFRTTDIIGRTGLSEFAVYMNNLPSDTTAYERAEKLCGSLESVCSFEHTRNGITVSIGIALQRDEQDYQTMFAHANTALVTAKKVSASSFEVFSQATQ